MSHISMADVTELDAKLYAVRNELDGLIDGIPDDDLSDISSLGRIDAYLTLAYCDLCDVIAGIRKRAAA